MTDAAPDEILDADVVEETTAAEPTTAAAPVADVVRYQPGSTALIEAATPDEKITVATAMATTLNNVIVKQGMRTKVGRRKVIQADGSEKWEDKYHVNVEAWETLGAFLNCVPIERYCRPAMGPDGAVIEHTYVVHEKRTKNNETVERDYTITGHDWEAYVEIVRDGVVVGSATGRCSRSESAWSQRDDPALAAMAVTRAKSRAYRAPAGWIVNLAGYSSTPAEEMSVGAGDGPAATAPALVEASDELQQVVQNVCAFFADGDIEAANAMSDALAKNWDGQLPAVAGQAVLIAAKALKDFQAARVSA